MRVFSNFINVTLRTFFLLIGGLRFSRFGFPVSVGSGLGVLGSVIGGDDGGGGGCGGGDSGGGGGGGGKEARGVKMEAISAVTILSSIFGTLFSGSVNAPVFSVGNVSLRGGLKTESTSSDFPMESCN